MSSELHVPDHMSLKSSARYDAILEARIKELEQGTRNLYNIVEEIAFNTIFIYTCFLGGNYFH